MFDPKPLNASTSSTNAPSTPITFHLPQPMTGLQRAQARRSSVPNIPSIFVNEGEAEGELSMDLETESEGSDSDDGGEAGDVQPHCAAHDAQGHDEDAEGEEVDMDVTKFVYGGILRRPSIPANTSITSEVSVVETDGEEEEKTMDFTIAIGGLLPHSPPVGAVSDRASIGYSVPMSPSSSSRRLIPGQLMEGELETEMDETFAIGGIIGADESISSGSGSAEDTMQERTMTFSFGNVRASADEGMEMTVAAGGIIGLSPHSPAPLTRPASGTPSFARPTMSSAQKEKRNVFAPSPSPFKTTPRKSGMDAAGAVAKRLSFGSTTSSGGRKRAREEDGMDGSAKRSRIDSAEGVFGSTSVLAASPIRSATSPRKPLGTPMRMTKSPARSPALRRMLGEEVEGGLSNEQEWEQPPTISLTAFLEMAGVQFMEGLPGLNRRRSSVARGILGQSHSGGNSQL